MPGASEREHSSKSRFQSFLCIYIGIMAYVQLPDLCLGFPIDHRLQPLLGTGLTTRYPFVGPGGHARAIESYGRFLQQYRVDISDNEVNFAKWLAMPETKGGVVIVLLQPAEHQRYFYDHHQTMKDCDTLDAVDEVCKAVTGCGLEKISCFDAFPFHKIPVNKSIGKYDKVLDEAYAVFLDMIQQKQPDVVFCCYRSPHSTKYKDFHCIGIGRTRDYQVTVQGQLYTCVNGFHPSYALNFVEDESELRSLFIIEATQAFRRANGTWRKSSWMTDVRENFAAIVQTGKRLFLILFFSSYKLWRLTANITLVLKIRGANQAGLSTTSNVSDSSYT